ncbi:MAG: divergent polysaccharide deacetylase family protein [Candidatus Margulisiibacteriota bacterium]|mgnify:FL=1
MRRLLIALFSVIILANLALFVFRYTTIEKKLETYQGPPEVSPVVESTEHRYRIAIVLDDLGVKTPDYHLLNDIAYKLNLAVIPGLKNSKELVREMAQDPRYELLLHMPMEPLRRSGDMESGAQSLTHNYPFLITHNLSKRSVRKILDQAFDAIEWSLSNS